MIQIGFLDFDLFTEALEFYATYMIKNNILYTDKLRMSVIELNHIELATEEDRRYGIDKWAAFFKIKTWEELKAMAATNQYMQSAIFELSSDENIRELCRRRAEYEADERHNARNVAIIAEQKSIIAQQKSIIAEKESTIARQESDIAEKESIIAQQQAEYAQLLTELQSLRESQRKTSD